MADRLLDLLRHGEALGGACFRGRRDDPASPIGWQQMSQAATADPGWTGVITAPARRCSDFARHLAETRGLPLATVSALGERDFGAWEGLTADQIPPQALARFWDDPIGFTPPGGEPFADFRDRVLLAWDELLDQAGAATLVVTHGGVMRVLLAHLLRMPPADAILIEVPHACLTRLRIPEPPGRPSLMRHGGP